MVTAPNRDQEKTHQRQKGEKRSETTKERRGPLHFENLWMASALDRCHAKCVKPTKTGDAHRYANPETDSKFGVKDCPQHGVSPPEMVICRKFREGPKKLPKSRPSSMLLWIFRARNRGTRVPVQTARGILFLPSIPGAPRGGAERGTERSLQNPRAWLLPPILVSSSGC